MKVHVLERELRLAVGIGEAWAFFSDASNLARITPPVAPRLEQVFDHRRRVLEATFGALP